MKNRILLFLAVMLTAMCSAQTVVGSAVKITTQPPNNVDSNFILNWNPTTKVINSVSKANLFPPSIIPTLQQILDNNHDLGNGNNFQGTGAGFNNGSYATNNIGFGYRSLENNSGTSVNSFGWVAGFGNRFNNVNLFGEQASADGDFQTVFAKNVREQARISFNNITGFKKFELPNKNGTIALIDDVDTKANINSPIFTGLPYASTANINAADPSDYGQNYQIANTNYVNQKIGISRTSISNAIQPQLEYLKVNNVTSSASTLSLVFNFQTTYFTNIGSATTWTLPPVSGHIGKRLILIASNSGTITLNSASGGNDINRNGTLTNTFPISAGTYITLYNNGIYWLSI